MATGQLSRRSFTQLLGLGAGAALLPVQARGLEERLALGGRAWLEPAKLLPKDPQNLILLNSNENPYGPSPAAREAMIAAHGVACRYPDYHADLIHEKVAAYHGVSPEMVEVTCGSTEVLKVSAMAFLAPGKRLVVADPTFEAMARYAQLAGAEVVKVPCDATWRHDLEAMAEAARERPGLVYLCNPNNPTGTLVSRAAIEKFVAQMPAESVALVDEAYFHFADDPAYGTLLDAVKAGANVVVARTFSKIYGMAGLRLGYAVARRDLIARMRPHQVSESWNVMACAAALASLEDKDWVTRNQKLNRDARTALAEALRRRGREFIPSETNFVCVHVGGPVRPVIQAFRARGISVGRPFARLDEHIRVSLGTPEEMKKFVAAFDAVVAHA
jgi:histidinol-phosphate aminotransferase